VINTLSLERYIDIGFLCHLRIRQQTTLFVSSIFRKLPPAQNESISGTAYGFRHYFDICYHISEPFPDFAECCDIGNIDHGDTGTGTSR
jgi:hypothetical protein